MKAQTRVETLTARLSGVTDHEMLTDIGAELGAAHAELEDLEAAWLELAELQESSGA